VYNLKKGCEKMKKILTAILAISLLCIGCSANKDEEQTTNTTTTQDTTNNDTETNTNTETNETDTSTKTFEDWSAEGVLNYFRDNGAIEHEDYVLIQEGEDVTSSGVSQIASYLSKEDDSITIDIYYFDKDSNDEKIINAYNEAKDQKTFTFESGGQYTFDHFVDGIAFQFSLCTDNEVKQKFEDVYNKLIKEYNLKATY
jgi:uncharacterized protein YxeA